MGNLGILELGPMFCWYQKLFREGKESASEMLHAGEQGDTSGALMLYLLGGKLQQLYLSLSWIISESDRGCK